MKPHKSLQGNSRDRYLPLAVSPRHMRAGRASRGRWRHCAAFIAQLAGQYSSRRRDALHHWIAPGEALESYRAGADSRPGPRFDERV